MIYLIRENRLCLRGRVTTHETRLCLERLQVRILSLSTKNRNGITSILQTPRIFCTPKLHFFAGRGTSLHDFFSCQGLDLLGTVRQDIQSLISAIDWKIIEDKLLQHPTQRNPDPKSV